MEQPNFYFWKSDGSVWIRVIGPGTFQNSTQLKDFAKEMIAKDYRDFVIDLRECPEVDSTFMGACAFIGIRMRERSGNIRIVNASPEVAKLFSDLGLNKLIQFEPGE